MVRSSDSVQVETAAPLLRVALIVVLIVAAVAGMLVVASSQIGWAALGLALVVGPVAVVAEGRSRTHAPVAAIPRTTLTPPAPVQAPRQPEAHWQLAEVQGRPSLVLHWEG